MNKPSDKADLPLLAENGVVITKTHLSAGGQTFAFAEIQFVRVDKAAQHPLAVFLKQPPTYRLFVSNAEDASLITVLETQDPAFLKRVTTAMDQVAASNPHGRRTK